MNGGEPRVRPAQIAAAGRDLRAPFTIAIAIAGGELSLPCRRILRLLPGRRLVAEVAYDDRAAVLKLFVGRRAARYARREARGCEALAAAGVTTPRLLRRLTEPGRAGARALLFEHVAGARPVAAGDDPAVSGAAAELARLHAAGARHHDLHLDNFLQSPSAGGVFVVDGDGVRRARRTPLDEATSLNDLAVLCAQRPPWLDDRLEPVLRAYEEVRGWDGTSRARRLQRLRSATRRERSRRVARYLAKAQRDCSEFRQTRGPGRWLVAVRSAWSPELERFADDPEAALAGATLLKAGNSATVARVRLGGRTWVVKRYNRKSAWHAVKRALRPRPRFRLAWLNGQRLHFLGIPTARPVLLVERRRGPLRGRAYLVMEDLGDLDLAREVAAAGLSEQRLAQVVELFRALAAAGLRHGDTKASNFIVHEDAVHLVDLDALREHAGTPQKDVARFLANFDDHPAVRARLAAALAEAGTAGGFAAPEAPL